MEYLSIDRFEDDIAVCEREDMSVLLIRRDKLPIDAQPGNIIRLTDDGGILLDIEEENRRRQRISELYDGIFDEE
ncbi:MAG: DUF3006 domain-containing protein [Acutalibacteraceae bacterium]|jgi:hypothetical protein